MKLTLEIEITHRTFKAIVYDENKQQIGMISEILESYTQLDHYFKMLAQVISVIQRILKPEQLEKEKDK